MINYIHNCEIIMRRHSSALRHDVLSVPVKLPHDSNHTGRTLVHNRRLLSHLQCETCMDGDRGRMGTLFGDNQIAHVNCGRSDVGRCFAART